MASVERLRPGVAESRRRVPERAPQISVVVPLLNEEATVAPLYAELAAASRIWPDALGRSILIAKLIE